MYRAKEGDREGYIERGREIGEERRILRVREIEIDTIWRGKHQQTIQYGKGWVNAKIG